QVFLGSGIATINGNSANQTDQYWTSSGNVTINDNSAAVFVYDNHSSAGGEFTLNRNVSLVGNNSFYDSLNLSGYSTSIVNENFSSSANIYVENNLILGG